MLLALLFLVSFAVLRTDGLSTLKGHPRVLHTQLYSGFGKKEMNSAVLRTDGLSTLKGHPRVLHTQLYSGFGKKEMNSGAMLHPTDPCGCNSGNTYGR